MGKKINWITWCAIILLNGCLSLSLLAQNPSLLQQELSKATGKDSYEKLSFDLARTYHLTSVIRNPLLGPNVADVSGTGPLHYAVFTGNVALTEELLKLGAHPNQEGRRGLTPLMLSTLYTMDNGERNIKLASLLLGSGANIDYQNSDDLFSALMVAAINSRSVLLEYLIARGAKLDLVDYKGRTALMLATKECDFPAVKALVNAGADTSIKSEKDYTALIYYQKYCIGDHADVRIRDLLDPPSESSSCETSATANALIALTPSLLAESIVEKNEYVTNRGMIDYLKAFGSTYEEALRKLAPSDHMLDAGSGETVAMIQYLEGQKTKDLAIANVSAVTFKLKKDLGKELEAKAKLNLKVGRYFEDIPDEEFTSRFGKVKVISDFWGVLAYTHRPSEVLRKYFRLLDHGGRVFVMMGDEIFETFSGQSGEYLGRHYEGSSQFRSLVLTKGGETISFPEWLKRLPGVKVTPHYKADSPRKHQTFLIEVADGEGPQVPELELIELGDPKILPPKRVFKER